jgi:predicted transcriptional regulator/ribosomal protein L17
MGQPEFVLRLLDGRHGSMTFAEVMGKVNDTRTAVQKTLSYLYKEHRISRVQDNDGIMSYNITPHGKQWLTKADEQRNGSGEKKIKYEPPTLRGKKITSVWMDEAAAVEAAMAEAADIAQELSQKKVVDVTEAHAKDTKEAVQSAMTWANKEMLLEERRLGFSEGYEAGVREAAREAYEDGKRSVMKKLEVLLCGA